MKLIFERHFVHLSDVDSYQRQLLEVGFNNEYTPFNGFVKSFFFLGCFDGFQNPAGYKKPILQNRCQVEKF